MYKESKPYSKKETKESFIERIRKEANSKQIEKIKFNRKKYEIIFGVSGPIITSYGKFQLVPAQVKGGKWGNHYFLFYPSINELLKKKEMILRIDSGCFSGGVLGDITCDCQEQLRISQKACVANKGGIVIEIPNQDGRGWSQFKMANQRLMDELGMTTAEAAEAFYKDKPYDIRTYDEAVIILKAFGFGNKHSFDMATNNPKKIEAFKNMGMNISCVKSVAVGHPNHFVKRNLKSKEDCWGHNFHNGTLKTGGVR